MMSLGTGGRAEAARAVRRGASRSGEGVAPWREIFAAAESTGGVEFYLMEQEGSRYSEYESQERCLATWRQMRG